MPIDPRILFQLNAPPDPVESMARAAQLRSMMTSNASSLLDLQQKRKKIQDQENMDAAAHAAYQTPAPVTAQAPSMNLGGVSLPGSTSTVQGPAQFDRAAFLSKLSQTNPLDAVGMQGQFTTQDAAQQKAGLDIHEQVQKLQKTDLDMALTKIKTANQQIGSVMALPPELRPQGYARAVQGLKQNGLIDPNHPEQYPGDDAIKGELAQGLSAEQIFQQEKDSRDFAYKQQQDKANRSVDLQAMDAFLKKNPGKDASDFLAFKAKNSPSAMNGQLTLTPAATAMAANLYAQTGQLPSGFGRSPQVTSSVINQAATTPGTDIAANKIAYQGKKSTETYFTTGAGAKQLTAFNTAMTHLDTLQRLAGDLDNSNVQIFNKAKQAFADQTGNPAPANFAAAKNAMAGEVAAALKASGATDQEITHVSSTFDRAQSPAQLNGAINTYRELLRGKRDQLQRQYEQGAQGKANFGQAGAISVTDPQGGVHTFPDQASADKFKALANIK